jgi:hypothetical protein
VKRVELIQQLTRMGCVFIRHGLRELLEKEFLFRSTSDGVFFHQHAFHVQRRSPRLRADLPFERTPATSGIAV